MPAPSAIPATPRSPLITMVSLGRADSAPAFETMLKLYFLACVLSTSVTCSVALCVEAFAFATILTVASPLPSVETVHDFVVHRGDELAGEMSNMP